MVPKEMKSLFYLSKTSFGLEFGRSHFQSFWPQTFVEKRSFMQQANII